MHYDLPVPFEKLFWFQKKLGLDEAELAKLAPYREFFIGEKETFAETFFKYFREIPETKIIIEHEKRPGYLKGAWAKWFEALFKKGFDRTFLTFHWRSGLRHVEVNIDHRFITLGYSLLRQYCSRVVRKRVPREDQDALIECIDKMVDYCLLIETQAFVEATAQCDIEVVRGISHQVRNPLTVIGGNILRLKKKGEPRSPVHNIYDAILEENRRLEKMVIDVGVYSDLFQKEMVFSEIPLPELLTEVIEGLEKKGEIQKTKLEMEIAENIPALDGDREVLKTMFIYLLENSLEGADPEKPYVRISAKLWGKDRRFMEVEVFNNGTPPRPEDVPSLFVPFHSSKPYGTGFGLAIAQFAAHKGLGELFLVPLPGEGTKYVIRLPVHIEK